MCLDKDTSVRELAQRSSNSAHKLEANTTWPSKELAVKLAFVAGPQETHFPHCISMVGGKMEGSSSSMPPEAYSKQPSWKCRLDLCIALVLNFCY